MYKYIFRVTYNLTLNSYKCNKKEDLVENVILSGYRSFNDMEIDGGFSRCFF